MKQFLLKHSNKIHIISITFILWLLLNRCNLNTTIRYKDKQIENIPQQVSKDFLIGLDSIIDIKLNKQFNRMLLIEKKYDDTKMSYEDLLKEINEE